MAEKRRGLGRGLGALIPQTTEEAPETKTKTQEPQKSSADAGEGTSGAGRKKAATGETKSGAEGKSASSTSRSRTSSAGKKTAGNANSTARGKTAQSKTPQPQASQGEPEESQSTQGETEQKKTAAPKTAAEKPAAQGKNASESVSDSPVAEQVTDAQSDKTKKSGDATETGDVSRETSSSASAASNAKKQNVSRETSTAKETRKRRADMGAALRNTTTARRPVDFFFGSNEDDGEQLVPVPGAEFAELNVKDIHPNRKQPRSEFDEQDMEELVHSIKEIGVLQPIVVRPSREKGAEKYELVMGERRWRATQRAGLTKIPAIVRDTQDVDLLRDALLENLHRSQLNPIEEAAAYQQLLDEFGTTQEQLAQRIGRSRPQISNTLRLLKLPALVQRRVAAGVLSSGHARALLALRSQAEMERIAQKTVNEGLSVRSVEELVAASSQTPKKERKAPQPQKHHERLDYIAEAFADKLDTDVKIQLGARKGKMTIEFASVEDLNRIISVLDPKMKK